MLSVSMDSDGDDRSLAVSLAPLVSASVEGLVREVIDHLSRFRAVEERVITTTEENMVFKLPRQLTD